MLFFSARHNGTVSYLDHIPYLMMCKFSPGRGSRRNYLLIRLFSLFDAKYSKQKLIDPLCQVSSRSLYYEASKSIATLLIISDVSLPMATSSTVSAFSDHSLVNINNHWVDVDYRRKFLKYASSISNLGFKKNFNLAK